MLNLQPVLLEKRQDIVVQDSCFGLLGNMQKSET